MKRICKKCGKRKKSTEFEIVGKEPAKEFNGYKVHIFKDICDVCAKGRRR